MNETEYKNGILAKLREKVRPSLKGPGLEESLEIEFGGSWDCCEDELSSPERSILTVEIEGYYFRIEYETDFEGSETGEVFEDWSEVTPKVVMTTIYVSV